MEFVGGKGKKQAGGGAIANRKSHETRLCGDEIHLWVGCAQCTESEIKSPAVRWHAPYRQVTEERVLGNHHLLSGLDITTAGNRTFGDAAAPNRNLLRGAMSQNCTATTVKTTFGRETSVLVSIDASSETVWNLLATAEKYPEWNSTVISIKGNIELGNTIILVSTLDPSREFNLKIKEFQPNQKLVWGDRQGSRVYTLDSKDSKLTIFSMVEKIGGILFPLYGNFIPPFDQAFEQFAMDLKTAAETGEQ